VRRLVFAFALVSCAVTAVMFASTADAQTGSLTFNPSHVVAGGGKLFINGTCEANTSGFVISHALAGQPSGTEFAGVPALAITTSSTGTFGIGVTIAPTVTPGAYAVSLRCGGGLAASGTLTVTATALPRTGASDQWLATGGAVLLVAGVTLSKFDKRTRIRRQLRA